MNTKFWTYRLCIYNKLYALIKQYLNYLYCYTEYSTVMTQLILKCWKARQVSYANCMKLLSEKSIWRKCFKNIQYLYITKTFKIQCKYKIVSFKIYGLKYILKHKIQVTFCAIFKWGTNVPCSYCVVCHLPCEHTEGDTHTYFKLDILKLTSLHLHWFLKFLQYIHHRQRNMYM